VKTTINAFQKLTILSTIIVLFPQTCIISQSMYPTTIGSVMNVCYLKIGIANMNSACVISKCQLYNYQKFIRLKAVV